MIGSLGNLMFKLHISRSWTNICCEYQTSSGNLSHDSAFDRRTLLLKYSFIQEVDIAVHEDAVERKNRDYELESVFQNRTNIALHCPKISGDFRPSEQIFLETNRSVPLSSSSTVFSGNFNIVKEKFKDLMLSKSQQVFASAYKDIKRLIWNFQSENSTKKMLLRAKQKRQL